MDEWHDFFIMIGPAAASLIGLLFVVATLTSGSDRETARRGGKIYTTPTVFHFALIVLISALCLAPHVPLRVVGGVSLACAAAGLAYSAFVGSRLEVRRFATAGEDFWTYSVAVGALYVAVAVAGILLWRSSPAGPYTLAASLLALLLLVVRNAWDLVTWIAPGADLGQDPARDAPRP